jgi:hypothetical protein
MAAMICAMGDCQLKKNDEHIEHVHDDVQSGQLKSIQEITVEGGILVGCFISSSQRLEYALRLSTLDSKNA